MSCLNKGVVVYGTGRISEGPFWHGMEKERVALESV